MIPLKVWLIIAGICASIFAGGAAYWQGKIKGEAECRLEQSQSALKLEKQVRESNDKIDKETPFNATVDQQFKWVLKQSERFHKTH